MAQLMWSRRGRNKTANEQHQSTMPLAVQRPFGIHYLPASVSPSDSYTSVFNLSQKLQLTTSRRRPSKNSAIVDMRRRAGWLGEVTLYGGAKSSSDGDCASRAPDGDR